MNDKVIGIDNIKVKSGLNIHDLAKWNPRWMIEKYHGKVCPENLYAVEEFDGNCLLNEGITELLTLLIGGSATAFNNANAYIGIGDSTTAAAATQAGLQAATNKTYKGMDSVYPQVSDQTVMFQATFGENDANYEWQEISIANGNSDAAKNLNRKVQWMGEKAQGTSWVARCQISLS
jgi:hypothetical protein